MSEWPDRYFSSAYLLLAWSSFVLAFTVIVLHLHFVFLPIALFALYFLAYLNSSRRSLQLFLLLLPLVNSLPALFFNGYPFNYMALPLFALAGMALAAHWRGKRLEFNFPGSRVYLLFLGLLWISALFVFVRWSNILHSPLAFFHDTPITPSGQRLSFACIFPVLTLFIFSFAPLLAAIWRRHGLGWQEGLHTLFCGFTLSLALALMQKTFAKILLRQSLWMKEYGQVNGGFSDFNAFGFFSGVLFLVQTVNLLQPQRPHRRGRLVLELFFLLTALCGILLSGCRTAFLFILAAVVFTLLQRGTPKWVRAIFIVAVALFFLAFGGILKTRLSQFIDHARNLSSSGDLAAAIDRLSNGRLQMLQYSLPMFGSHPLTGVGAGNFLFYLKYSKFGSVNYYEDLPLNQYLLVLDETGFPGLILFAAFLWLACRGASRSGRWLLLTAMVGLFFNFFFWFPECTLLFFLVIVGGKEAEQEVTQPRWGKKALLGVALVLIFSALAHILQMRSLDPVTWAREKGTRYDYGFWYEEKGAGGEFRWSKAAAGRYVFPGKPGRIRLFCGAPLRLLHGGKQTLRIYWRGKLQRVIVFYDNRSEEWRPPDNGPGFWEIRVTPAFNLKAMGYGAESRDLGVQVFEE